MAKLHGLETLFFGTAVVYANEGVEEFVLDINQSVERLASMLLILLILHQNSFPITKGYSEGGTGSALLHGGATGQTATETVTPSAFSCIGCKSFACRFVTLVVHFQP